MQPRLPSSPERLLVAALAALLLAPAPARRTVSMTERFTTLGGQEIEPPAAVPIHASAGAPIPRAAALGEPAVRTASVNPAHNGRLPWATGFAAGKTPDPLEVAWSAPLLPRTRPSAVLWWRDRILVQGETSWQLFTLDGAPLKAGYLGDSGITIDPVREVFFSATSTGLVAARRLGDGRDAFVVGLLTGDDHTRALIAPHAGRLLTVSSRSLIGEHEGPDSASVESTDIGPPAAPKSLDGLDEPVAVALLKRSPPFDLAAVQDGTMTLASTDRLYRLDADLRFQRVFSGSFHPEALSLDEGGRSYLVVTAAGVPTLWLIGPDGDRRYTFAIPSGAGMLRQPPVVGFDHTVYLVMERMIVAVASDGTLLWARRNRGAVAGAAVTSDDWLLVSDGHELAAYDRDGQRFVLHAFATPLVTAPVLTTSDEYLVATAAELHGLRKTARSNADER